LIWQKKQIKIELFQGRITRRSVETSLTAAANSASADDRIVVATCIYDDTHRQTVKTRQLFPLQIRPRVVYDIVTFIRTLDFIDLFRDRRRQMSAARNSHISDFWPLNPTEMSSWDLKNVKATRPVVISSSFPVLQKYV